MQCRVKIRYSTSQTRTIRRLKIMQNVTWKKKLKIIILASSSTSKGVNPVHFITPGDFYNEIFGNIRLHQNIVQDNLSCFAEMLKKWEKFPAKDHVPEEACFTFSMINSCRPLFLYLSNFTRGSQILRENTTNNDQA